MGRTRCSLHAHGRECYQSPFVGPLNRPRIPNGNAARNSFGELLRTDTDPIETRSFKRHGLLILVESEATADLMHVISSSSSTGLAK
jgi:hypothetical protein